MTQTNDEIASNNLASEFLTLHHRCGPVEFDQLKEITMRGIVPKKFANAPTLACTTCMYAKAIQKWRDKDKLNHNPIKYTKPGEYVSIN